VRGRKKKIENMQLAVFYISEGDQEALDRCNQFMRSHRVVSVQEQFIPGMPSKWSIFVKYIGTQDAPNGNPERKDYRDILSEEDFSKFARMRDVRKQMAEELLLPAYVIFTNEELSQFAKMKELDASLLQSVHGVGPKKVERFGKRFIELYQSQTTNEKNG
jgi:superfamily II DNA helicase RecQ